MTIVFCLDSGTLLDDLRSDVGRFITWVNCGDLWNTPVIIYCYFMYLTKYKVFRFYEQQSRWRSRWRNRNYTVKPWYDGSLDILGLNSFTESKLYLWIALRFTIKMIVFWPEDFGRHQCPGADWWTCYSCNSFGMLSVPCCLCVLLNW